MAHALGTERDIQRLVDHMARHKGSGDPRDSSGSSGSDSETSSSSSGSDSDANSDAAQQPGMPVRLSRRLSLTGDGDEQLFQEVVNETASGDDASMRRKPSRRGSRFVEFWCVQLALDNLLFESSNFEFPLNWPPLHSLTPVSPPSLHTRNPFLHT